MIHVGDCLLVMPALDANSIDAIVTDPPYGLGFMGKDWDHGVPGEHFWAEALRVAKPGAHLVAFGGTRTYHRLICAIEDAGWEIRDCLMWVYGSGFPKSLDVSKAIDKTRDDSADIEHVRQWLEAKRADAGLSRKDVNERLGLASNGGGLMSSWTTNRTTRAVPQWEQWLQLKDLLCLGDEMDAKVWRLNGRKGTPGNERARQEPQRRRQASNAINASGFGKDGFAPWVNEAATDAARQWQGWGTALKPAWEPIILARKPLQGTVAANVLKHGTGAMNIGGCRIGAETIRSSGGTGMDARRFEQGTRPRDYESKQEPSEHQGRWPANVAHDGSDEVVAMFPSSVDGVAGKRSGVEPTAMAGKLGAIDEPWGGFGGSGSAARFFYTAKADHEDRNWGCEELEERSLHWSSGHKNPGSFQAEGTNREARNNHPTVKPHELMRWLCRLVTPPGGMVLDPFCGSGSTGRAAMAEGMQFVGIELDPHYAAIAEARMRATQPGLAL